MSQEVTVSPSDAMNLPVQRKPSVSRMMSLRESIRKQSWPSLSLSFSLSNKTKVVPKMINSDNQISTGPSPTESKTEEKIEISLEEMEQQKSIKKYKNNVPTLDWSDTYAQKDIWHTGWNPLAGINVCFKEDYTPDNEKLSIIIERQAMRNTVAFAIGCFFAKDPKTGFMALTYRVKPLHGAEHAVVYYDINYFGLSTERVVVDGSESEESKFIVSNEWQDKALRTGVNFCHPDYIDFQHVVTYINDFVQKHRRANEVSQAFQLLSLCRSNRVINNENDIIDQSHTIGPLAEAVTTSNLYHTIDVYPTLGTSHSFASLPSSGNLELLGSGGGRGGEERRLSSSIIYTNQPYHHPNNLLLHTSSQEQDRETNLTQPSYLRSRNSTRSLHHSYRDDESYYNTPLPNQPSSERCCPSSSQFTSPTSSIHTHRTDGNTISPSVDTTQNSTNSIWSPDNSSHCYISTGNGSYVFPNSPQGTRYRTASVGRIYSSGNMLNYSGRTIGEEEESEERMCGGGGVREREQEEEVLVEVIATMLSQS